MAPEHTCQHPMQPPAQPPAAVIAMSASGASATTSTSNGSSSRRATASSAASSSSTNSASRATPATTTSTFSVANNAVASAGGGAPAPAVAAAPGREGGGGGGMHAQLQQQQRPLPLPPLLETLPSAETQRHIAEARAAVVASIGNMLDTELQSRAAMLHGNAAALDRQERDVLAATEALRRERERLAREADGAARRLKEVGNVQNWAEVLERGLLVLEETVRRANRGGGGGGSDGDGGDAQSWSGSGSEGSECSCSDCGKTLDGGQEAFGGVMEGEEEEEEGGGGGGKMDVDEDAEAEADHALLLRKGKGKEEDVVMEEGVEAMSDTSRSLFDGESSTATGTGMAKNSETASLSTNC